MDDRKLGMSGAAMRWLEYPEWRELTVSQRIKNPFPELGNDEECRASVIREWGVFRFFKGPGDWTVGKAD